MNTECSDCRACGGVTTFFSCAEVFNNVAIYSKCGGCESVQIESPDWLESAHSSAISKLDTGLVSRCISASRFIGAFLFYEKQTNSTGFDWGAGTGLLTRLLRDQGFYTSSYDKYADSVHSVGFQVDDIEINSASTFLLAIECIEHLVNPLETLETPLGKKQYFIFTTDIIGTPPPDPASKTWWYFAPETGQHVTFLSRAGVLKLTKRLGFEHYYNFESFHIMSKSKLKIRTKIYLRNRVTRKISLLLIPEILKLKHSLTFADKDVLTKNSDSIL